MVRLLSGAGRIGRHDDGICESNMRNIVNNSSQWLHQFDD